MNPIRTNLEQLKNKTIPIGREGENEYTVVRIDCGEVFKEYPQAVVNMKVKPPKGIIYPVTVERDGNEIVWTVHDYDLASKGDGQFQLKFTEGTMIHKTVIGRTLILKSLEGDGPAPTPIQDWMDEAQEALDAVEDAEVNQPMIGEDGYWYTWNQEDGEYQKTDTKAEGQDGHTPVLTSSKSGKTTTIYADGDQLAQIQDGQDANIDDTSTAADKVWSAAKSNTLLSDLTSVQNDVYTNIWTPETLTLTDGVYYMPTGKPSTYSSAKSSAAVAVTVGDVLKVTAKTQANVPGIIFYNSSTLSTETFVSYACYTGSTQQYVDEPVTVPTGAKYAIVQGLKANDVILKAPQKAAKFAKYDADIASIQDNDSYMTKLFCNRMMAIGKPSGFSWGSRQKFILSIRVDDLRTDVDKVAKIIMGEYGFPMMIAACVKELNKTVTGITDPAEKIGDTRLEVCQWVQQHGGEILVHPNETVTTADYNTSVKPLFLDARKVLEDNGIKIRGTAVANATPNATLKAGLDPYMYGYFDYSDGYGSIAPYADITTTMIGGWGSDVSQFTGWLNGRIASTSWRTLVIHELGDDVTEQALRDMLDILATHVQNGDLILANWSTVYDTYGTH